MWGPSVFNFMSNCDTDAFSIWISITERQPTLTLTLPQILSPFYATGILQKIIKRLGVTVSFLKEEL